MTTPHPGQAPPVRPHGSAGSSPRRPLIDLLRDAAGDLPDGPAESLPATRIEAAGRQASGLVAAVSGAVRGAAEADRERFRNTVTRVWGPALSLHRCVLELADQCTTELLTQRRARSGQGPEDPRFGILLGFQARMSRVGLEVHDLVSDGLPRAATARARTGHETAVFAALISTYGSPEGEHADLSARYRAHARVQRYKDALAQHREAPGSLSAEELDRAREQSSRAIERYGPELHGPWGWAALLVDPAHRQRIQFPELESLAGLEGTRLGYREANHEVHATSRSLELNTRMAQPGVLRLGIGRELQGIADPVARSTRSTIQVVTTLLTGAGTPGTALDRVALSALDHTRATLDAELSRAEARAAQAAGPHGPAQPGHATRH